MDVKRAIEDINNAVERLGAYTCDIELAEDVYGIFRDKPMVNVEGVDHTADPVTQIRQMVQALTVKEQTRLEAKRNLIKRIARTGALTYAGIHLTNPSTWKPSNKLRIPDDAVDRWMDAPGTNASRANAYKLADYLMGNNDS